MDIMNEKVTATVVKACKVTEYKDGPSKMVNLTVKFVDVSVRELVEKAVQPTIIQWQSWARAHFADLTNSMTVDFKSPGKTIVDPVGAMVSRARAAGINPADKAAMTMFLKREFGIDLDD